MKLTTEQIEYVENYIISKDIKWYGASRTDHHMVTSMEDFWESPEFSFHQVKQYAEINLGVMVLKLLKRRTN
jgi:hypothetical protein